jgi:DNA-binding LytR/AlgR family response regulator
MTVKVTIEQDTKEPYVEIHTCEITPQIQVVLDILGPSQNKIITGIKDKKIYILKPDEILCFYCEGQNVYAKTEMEVFTIKTRLFEIEELLKGSNFFRISNSAVANINQICNLELSFNGTMCVRFKNGSVEYASRRYVAKLKNHLGL